MNERVMRLRRALPTLSASFVWFAAVACLVVVPAVVGSLRTTSYEASILIDVYTNDRRLEDRVEHVKGVVPGIASAVAAESDHLVHPQTVAQRVAVASKGRLVQLTATGDTPVEARDLANVTGAVLKAASRNEIYPVRGAVTSAPESVPDRLLAFLPGPLPPPPHPIFSAAVGFLVALLLYAGWRRRFESGRSSTGPGAAG